MILDFDVLFFLILYVLFLPLYFLSGATKRYLFIHSIFFIYLLGVISVTLFPIPIYDLESLISSEYELKNNFLPFYSILEISTQGFLRVILRQIGGNILLLMPFGFLTPIIWKNKNKFWQVAILGLGFSLIIEFSQLLISVILRFNYKIFDVDDLILNTLGAMLGYGIYKMSEWAIKSK